MKIKIQNLSLDNPPKRQRLNDRLEGILEEEKVSEQNKPVYLAGMLKGIEIAQEVVNKK